MLGPADQELSVVKPEENDNEATPHFVPVRSGIDTKPAVSGDSIHELRSRLILLNVLCDEFGDI